MDTIGDYNIEYYHDYDDDNQYIEEACARVSENETSNIIATFKSVCDARLFVAAKILGPVSDANIEVDMIIQNQGDDNTTDFTFTVHRRDFAQAHDILSKTCQLLGAREVFGDDKIAKLSLVGVGMRSHAGIASTMFRVFGEEGINIQLISTSEIKVSVVMDEKYLELGVRALHTAFHLHEAPIEENKVA